MADAVILACSRSPMTRAGRGSLAYTRADDLGAQVIANLFEKIPGLSRADVEDVLIGCAMPEGEQGLNVARNIALLAGLPVTACGVTINRFCASSLEAINRAAMAVMCDCGELFVAGGVESMSHVPMGGFNVSLNERLANLNSPDAYIAMGLSAENIARKYSISREAQDRFACVSHVKAVKAWSEGRFTSEVTTVVAKSRDGNEFLVARDEIPRHDASPESMLRLKASFLKEGTVTAGNSSPLTDGAAAVIIASKKFAKKCGIKPIAKISAMAIAGVEPELMGEGPIFAIPKALQNARMKLKDIDIFELNEAFAAQAIAVIDSLSLDAEKVNVNGGALALGHPLGASGARIVTTLVNAMMNGNATTGIAAMCVGGGQGIATIVERA